jgi:hypothetical protein
LTGLTQHEVDQGVTFAEACRLLAAERRAGARPWVSWGDYDRHQFPCQFDGVEGARTEELTFAPPWIADQAGNQTEAHALFRARNSESAL